MGDGILDAHENVRIIFSRPNGEYIILSLTSLERSGCVLLKIFTFLEWDVTMVDVHD